MATFHTPRMTHYRDCMQQIYMRWRSAAREARPSPTGPTPIREDNTAVVDSYGRPTACYYALQQVIEEVRAFENVYMNFKWQNVMVVLHDEDIRNFQLTAIVNPLERHDKINSVATSQDIIIGTFKDGEGRDGFMFTNTTLPQQELTATVAVEFNNASKALIFAKGKRIIRDLNKSMLELQVAPEKAGL